MDQLLFGGWQSLFRTLVVGVLAYVTLVVFLRFSGKRTLSKMNAFDLVVTVALGSTLATVLLTKDVALADGALAFALLVGLQFAVTWSSVRARWVRQLVTGEPLMLLHRGDFLPSALRQARVTQDEIRAAVRAAGLSSLAEAEAVVLETDGSFSVIRRAKRVASPVSTASGIHARTVLVSSSFGSFGKILPRGRSAAENSVWRTESGSQPEAPEKAGAVQARLMLSSRRVQ